MKIVLLFKKLFIFLYLGVWVRKSEIRGFVYINSLVVIVFYITCYSLFFFIWFVHLFLFYLSYYIIIMVLGYNFMFFCEVCIFLWFFAICSLFTIFLAVFLGIVYDFFGRNFPKDFIKSLSVPFFSWDIFCIVFEGFFGGFFSVSFLSHFFSVFSSLFFCAFF